MPLITFQPSGIAIEVEPGTELLDAASRAGVEADAPCGGKGTCGNCAVRITAGRVVTDSIGILAPAEAEEGFVLACRSIAGREDATVELQERAGLSGGQFGDGEDLSLIAPDLLPRPEDLAPLTAKILLQVNAPRKADGLSDLDRLEEALRRKLGGGEIRWALPAMREAADALRAAGGVVTVTTHPHPDPPLEGEGTKGSDPPLEGEGTKGSDPPLEWEGTKGSDPPLEGEGMQGPGSSLAGERMQGSDHPREGEGMQGSGSPLEGEGMQGSGSPLEGEELPQNFPPLQGEGQGGDGVHKDTTTDFDTLASARPGVRVIAIEGGDRTARHFGAAIDVGTTTVAVQIVEMISGRILAAGTDYNRQLACGLDVISRIDYARRPDRREELTGRVLKTINRLIRQGAASCRLDLHEITSAVISGNTTMIHLLLGLNPEYIRLDPFTPTILSVPPLNAAAIGLHIGAAAPVLISPAVGSYVGGDITAGVLCTDLVRDGDDVCLFMDIGTNGEVVLGNREFLLTAACSAGPAFEGGGIKCGMRAAAGAVEKVFVDSGTGRATVQTIGRIRPRGICGSGMISLLAELLKAGWIDAAGRLDRDRLTGAIAVTGRRASYTLVPAESSATGRAIAIDEQDIENIIRAKAALYAACALMLAEVGMAFGDLSKIYIAGGFGRFLDLDDATTIGLLPRLSRERFHFIGNASLKGSYMALISSRHRKIQQRLARRMTYLELATTPAYMDQYTAALFLPHTDPLAFPCHND